MILVQIAQQAVSSTPGEVLGATGLGSCVALVLLAETSGRRGVAAGVAHVLLPDSRGGCPALSRDPVKFADTAVPGLVELMLAAGARRRTMRGALVGGARMFEFSSTSGRDIGERNVEALRRALRTARIEVAAEDVGGRSGRSVRVEVDPGRLLVRRSRGPEEELLSVRIKDALERRQPHGTSADRR